MSPRTRISSARHAASASPTWSPFGVAREPGDFSHRPVLGTAGFKLEQASLGVRVVAGWLPVPLVSLERRPFGAPLRIVHVHLRSVRSGARLHLLDRCESATSMAPRSSLRSRPRGGRGLLATVHRNASRVPARDAPRLFSLVSTRTAPSAGRGVRRRNVYHKRERATLAGRCIRVPARAVVSREFEPPGPPTRRRPLACRLEVSARPATTKPRVTRSSDDQATRLADFPMRGGLQCRSYRVGCAKQMLSESLRNQPES